MRGLKPSEHHEQVAIIEYWAYACKKYKLPEYALYAIPNGGSRHVVEAMNLKKEGVRKGIPDLSLDVSRGTYHGLKIELKVKPNKPSKEQLEVMQYLESAGYACAVCYSATEAIKVLEAYLND